ncbi:MAG TPA: phytanoyl-CoA dioxygenase family protein [Myxococcota bacterium]|nr:phytanoyl-CoA dioxygenase family protein [Myxococcota bacterium]
MGSDDTPGLSAAQVSAFRADGFLSLDAISPADEIARLREAYAELLGDHTTYRLRYQDEDPGGKQRVITQIFSPERQCPRLLETHYLANARRLGATLLGVDPGEVSFGGLMMLYKPPAAGRDAPWHQDEAYWEFPDQRCHSISVWMALDDVAVESGCMQYIPGSHARDLLPHRKPPGVEPIVVDAPFDPSSAVPCPLRAGGAVAHHCRTLHYSAPNSTGRPRRAFTTIVHGPRAPRVPPVPRTWLRD